MPGLSDRDTWFLLRGLTREAAHWGAFLPAFAGALAGGEVHAIDLPGTGARRAEDFPARIAGAVEAVRAEAERACPASRRGRTFVLGVSLGGMLTMEWAARHPAELAGVVVGASSARDVAPFWRRIRPAALPGLLAAGLRRDVARREAGIVRLVSNRREGWDETAAEWAEIQRQRPVERGQARRQIAAAARWRAPARLDVPALFLVGRGDRLVHPDCSVALARRYRAPLATHPSAGHDLTLDACEWVVDEVCAWRRGLA